ncbi:DUF3291 domain-containing protein [Streptomyces sp. NPDC045431]|uniref:DUF3291 domain-containing protein n=1 Tax=Streptomyces sp. NPDC045431 TaxID=3155613 RepID=UPI0033C40BD7
MPRIAFTTFAVLKQPYPHLSNTDFNELEPLVFGASESSPGFIARAEAVDSTDTKWTNFGRDYGAWGKFEAPSFYTGGRDDDTDTRASTLSLWTDLSSVRAYAYSGIHRQALRDRRRWFVSLPHRLYAAWWVADDVIPTWREACLRLEILNEFGPTAHAFDFKHPFDPDGNPLSPSEASHA